MRLQSSTAVRWLVGFTAAMVATSIAGGALLELRSERTGRGAYGFLVWNLILAWIPYVAALLVALVHSRGGSRAATRVGLVLFGVVWLLFLPNAPYILTDFIHLGRTGGMPLWFDAALIGTFAGTGLLLGLVSLLIVHRVVEARAGRVLGWTVALAALGLSALGVYLGRFPRFNSWDVLADPNGLVATVTTRLVDPLGNPFLLRFALGLTVLLIVCYAVAWVIGRGLLGPVSRVVATHRRLSAS